LSIPSSNWRRCKTNNKIADEIVSVCPERLVAWTVAYEIIVNYENIYL